MADECFHPGRAMPPPYDPEVTRSTLFTNNFPAEYLHAFGDALY